MTAAEWLPSSVISALVQLLRRLDLEVVGVEDISARAVATVGSCGGGAIRSFLGSLDAGPLAISFASLAMKGFVLLLPLLAALQWALRSLVLAKRLIREANRQGRPKPLRSGEMLLPVDPP